MPQPPPSVTPTVLAGDLGAEQLAVYMAQAEVAVDTETMGLALHRDRVCLVQLCDRSGQATLVRIPREAADAPLAERAPRLRRLLESPDVLKVFHFARFDVAALAQHLGIQVAPIYCTRTASRIARTYTERHGLKDVALDLLDVELNKAACHTDWSQPALSEAQIRYATGDVSLLLPLMDRLEAMLTREDRRDLAHDCFRAIPTFARLDLMGYDDVFSLG